MSFSVSCAPKLLRPNSSLEQTANGTTSWPRSSIVIASHYRETFNEEARIYADYSFDALNLLIEAIRNSRTNKIDLKDALRQIRYTGVVGNYSFSEGSSFSIGEASLVCIEGGELVVKSGAE